VISRSIWQSNSIKCCTNLGKSAMETLAMIKLVFGEESISRTLLFEWHVQTHWHRKKARQAKRKVKSMLIIFFDIKRISHKEFVLSGQIVNSAYYCDVLRRLRENLPRFRPERWRQKIDCCMTATSLALPFSPRNFLPKTTWLSSPTHPTFSVSPIEGKTEWLLF
jgi:hypothetical protein